MASIRIALTFPYRFLRNLPTRVRDYQIRRDFVRTFFDSEDDYSQYITEIRDGRVDEILEEASSEFHSAVENASWGGINLRAAERSYALIREIEPEVIVETGVCNGVSTLYILLALEQNSHGELHSIDYPYRANESLNEFRKETFEDFGGAAIPADKDPGWIIPKSLHDYWQLTIGKSQRELPKLLCSLDQLDMFLHDSEHSAPCMMFEFELAWEWLDSQGIILADDIDWNNSFEIFHKARPAQYGRVADSVGYLTKGDVL